MTAPVKFRAVAEGTRHRARIPTPRIATSCPPTTPTRPRATSPRRWCTSTTACRKITNIWPSRASTSKGKIVIARYGKSWRGTKPKVASEHGAVGCLIYSDPRDDGYFQGDVYPERSHAPGRRRAARQRDGHAAVSPAIRSRPAGLPSPAPSASPLAEAKTLDEDSGDADLLRRRHAAARRISADR